MKRQLPSLPLGQSLTILIAVLVLLGGAVASDPYVNVVYRFSGASDGLGPTSNLIADNDGNLYGTTEYGGADGYNGTVFKLTRPARPRDAWTETTLYTFGNHGDGARSTAGLIFDHAGNLYGTTSDSNAGGHGEVFQLAPPAAPGGAWAETVLYSFQGGHDGAYPHGGLVFDPAGNLYGTTSSSVFRLGPPTEPGGEWIFTLLHEFQCCTSDGWNSAVGLVRDQWGNLYGTTEWGGVYGGGYCAYLGCGTVFKVSPPSSRGGDWKEEVLYRFTGGSDGFVPFSGLVLDQAGNLYGTTYSGGTLGGGTAFQLTPPTKPGRAWTETVLHNFSYSADDGAAPVAALIFGRDGSLYGTTEFGGNPCVFNSAAYGCGVIFQLTPPGTNGGAWTETVIHLFTTGPLSAKQPGASLVFDKHGDLYGTTIRGGYNNCPGDGGKGCGTVFKVTW